MSSRTLTLSGDTSSISTTYFPAIQLDDAAQYGMALIRLDTWNSIPNIDQNNCNFRYRDENSTEDWKLITVDTGSYEIDNISAFLNNKIKEQNGMDDNAANPLQITANTSTLKCDIKCIYEIDFQNTENSIAPLLGFSKKSILKANKSHTSDSTVNIIKVNTILVRCNIVTGSYLNNKLDHIVYSFYPDASPGFKLDVVPQNLIYLPINTKQLDSVTVDIVDQDGKLIDFRGEQITLALHIKKLI